jgi:ribosomal protein S18 acetylase RimI-like enzyme
MAVDDVTVRPMAEADVPVVVEIHLRTFPGFFLSFLGPRFLTLLYRSIRTAPDGVALVAARGPVVGFAAGVTSQRAFFRRLVREQWWRFALAAAGAALRRPSTVPRLLRALRRPAESAEAAADAALLSIGVLPELEGSGIGSRLIESFVAEIGRRGAEALSLTTDRDDNDRVNRFYERHGFHVQRSYVTPEGRAILEYVRPTAGAT